MKMFRPLIAMAALLGFAAPTARESRAAGAVITSSHKGGAFGSSKREQVRVKKGRGGSGPHRIVTGYRFRTNSIRHVY